MEPNSNPANAADTPDEAATGASGQANPPNCDPTASQNANFTPPGWNYAQQNQGGTPPTSPASPPPAGAQGFATPKPSMFDWLRASGWHRSNNRIISGVCAGVAERLNIDPIIVRGLAVILVFFFGTGALVYIAAWLFLPTADTGRIIIEDAFSPKPAAYTPAPAPAPATNPQMPFSPAAAYPAAATPAGSVPPVTPAPPRNQNFSPAAPPPATFYRLPGPSAAFNQAVVGLMLLAICVGIVASALGGMPALDAVVLAVGLITLVLGGAMLLLALQRKRTSWLAWVTPLLVVVLVLPAATGLSLSGQSGPDGTDLSSLKDFSLDSGQVELQPGGKLNSLTADTSIDLRDAELGEPIEVRILDGDTNIKLSPEQPVEITLNFVSSDLELTSASKWQETEVKPNEAASLFKHPDSRETETVFGTDGQEYEVTHWERDYEDPAWDTWGSDTVHRTLTLRNAAASQPDAKVQLISINVLDGDVDITEMPSRATPPKKNPTTRRSPQNRHEKMKEPPRDEHEKMKEITL